MFTTWNCWEHTTTELLRVPFLEQKNMQLYSVAQRNKRHPVQLRSFTDGVYEVFTRKTGHNIYVVRTTLLKLLRLRC